MLTVLSAAAALACGVLHIEEQRPAQIVACELENAGEGRQTCRQHEGAAQPLFETENATVARLLFSLSAHTDEATVLQALRKYKSSALPETRCDDRRVTSGRRWAIPLRSTANGGFPVLEVQFVGGKVASARWQPTATLMFNASYIVVSGPGWVPPPEIGP